eukprot:RCo046972
MASSLWWVTLTFCDTEVQSGNFVPVGPNLGLVCGRVFRRFERGPHLIPSAERGWQLVAWDGLRLSRPAGSGTMLTLPRHTLRLSPIPLPPVGADLDSQWVERDWVFVWLEHDAFENFFQISTETPLPTESLLFLGYHSPPSEAFVLEDVYPTRTAALSHAVPLASYGGDKAYDPDRLPREQRERVLRDLQQLRDELIAPATRFVGNWIHPLLWACPTRWVYLPQDIHTFGATVTAGEGAFSGVLLRENPTKHSEVLGLYAGVPVGGQRAVGRFLDPNSEAFAVAWACWVWPGLQRQPMDKATLGRVVEYADRHKHN